MTTVRGEAAYYAGRRGMQVQHTRVDLLPPKWNCAVCAWSARVKRPNFPHRFQGALHAVTKKAA